MPQDANRLIWIDMEMTGLTPETDRIIEVALVVTDSALKIVAEAPVLVVHQDDVTLAAMDSWNQSTHGRSGLIEKVKTSALDEAMVQHGDHVVRRLDGKPDQDPQAACGKAENSRSRFPRRFRLRAGAFASRPHGEETLDGFLRTL